MIWYRFAAWLHWFGVRLLMSRDSVWACPRRYYCEKLETLFTSLSVRVVAKGHSFTMLPKCCVKLFFLIYICLSLNLSGVLFVVDFR